MPNIPGQPAYQTLAVSPRIGQAGVDRIPVTIKDIAVAYHVGLTNMLTTYGTGVLPEGAVLQKATDNNWYLYGVTLPATSPATTQAFLSLAAGGIPQMCVLIDAIDTSYNGASNPVMGQAYFSGNFILSFLKFATGTTYGNTGAASIDAFLRANNIGVEGTTPVTTQTYGFAIPKEDAPV